MPIHRGTIAVAALFSALCLAACAATSPNLPAPEQQANEPLKLVGNRRILLEDGYWWEEANCRLRVDNTLLYESAHYPGLDGREWQHHQIHCDDGEPPFGLRCPGDLKVTSQGSTGVSATEWKGRTELKVIFFDPTKITDPKGRKDHLRMRCQNPPPEKD